MSETQLQAAIIKALRQMGVWCVRTAVSAKRGRGLTGEEGLPDICIVSTGLIHGCCGSQSGWLEVKLPGQKLRPAQERWHAKARQHRALVATVTSVREAVETIRSWIAQP